MIEALNNQPSPETDSAFAAFFGCTFADYTPNQKLALAFTRELELNRDEAVRALEIRSETALQLHEGVLQLQAENAQLRIDIVSIRQQHQAEANEWKTDEEVTCECDRARQGWADSDRQVFQLRKELIEECDKNIKLCEQGERVAKVCNAADARLLTLAKLIWDTRWMCEMCKPQITSDKLAVDAYRDLVGIAAEINSGNFNGIDVATKAKGKQ